MNHLYYGDNLDVLRRYIKNESVDLVYLDPPFKSNQDYNLTMMAPRLLQKPIERSVIAG